MREIGKPSSFRRWFCHSQDIEQVLGDGQYVPIGKKNCNKIKEWFCPQLEYTLLREMNYIQHSVKTGPVSPDSQKEDCTCQPCLSSFKHIIELEGKTVN